MELLRRIGDGNLPDFAGKQVVVIGGGNVAMDVTRSAIRLGASRVSCVYRRRKEDMTALPEEVEGAEAEGAELLTLQAPVRIESDGTGAAVALWTQPQIPGEMDQHGRPRPNVAQVPERRVPADIIIVAVGQGVETLGFEQSGIVIQRGGTVLAGSDTRLPDLEGVFAGGDCVSGPATVIRAVAAGKVAADNIDGYLGYDHKIRCDVEIPPAYLTYTPPCGRVNLRNRHLSDYKGDFTLLKEGMTPEEAKQESSRCLRCDHFGFGIFKGGRNQEW